MDTENKKNKKTTWIVGTLVFMLGLLVLLPVLAGEDLLDQTLNRDQEDDGTNVSEIVDRPQDYIGERITIRAEVEEALGPHALTLEAPALFFDDDLLMIVRNSIEDPRGGDDELIYNDNDILEVTGIVRLFNANDIEREAGINLVDEDFDDFTGRPVLVAESIRKVAED